ncbi:MAG TPA: glycerol kinase GlpK [Chloroflexota bacterium]
MSPGEGLILAIDQGTTGTTAMLFDRAGRVRGRGYREITQHYPRPGWVSHDADEIWRNSMAAVAEAKAAAGVNDRSLAAIGITNQRETTVLWDAGTGEPIAPAVVWQCRRTAALCDELRSREGGRVAAEIRRRTGLVIDAYFSGTKIAWLLENTPGARDRAERGELRFGTIDSWLIWKLTGGEVHATDPSNASRTLLFNVHRLEWDGVLLEALGVPASLLPRVLPSSGPFGHTADGLGALGAGLPVAGAAGDQQAALFGQACFRPGMVKCTYGTGAFLLMQTGERAIPSEGGLLTTVAWGIGQVTEYALEGSVFIAGAALQWLRDELKIIESAAESEALAASVHDTGGVYLVPAFTGLGAPYWDQRARGALVGLTRGAGRAQIVRAALEAIAYQVRDVVDLMARESGLPLGELRADGGAAVNNLLCQLQADVLGAPVVRPRVTETTALGAAYLAGLAVGYWSSREQIAELWAVDRRFGPQMPSERRERLYRGWQRAVERARDWAIEAD